MNIEELEKKHWSLMILNDNYYDDNIRFKHTKLSIQFAIKVLKECINYNKTPIENSCQDNIENKIQELKQYLDEKV